LFLTTMTEIVAMRAPRRAKTIINKLLNSRAMTEEGLNWLTLATDPFHDAALSPCGLPDMSTTNSVVQCFTYTQNIAVPSFLTAGSIWDCQVFFCPTSFITPNATASTALTAINYTASSGMVNIPSPIPGGQFVNGGYNVVNGPTGFDWQQLNAPANAWQNVGNRLSYPAAASTGQYRLVACGYEVVNTTPDLYKGGSVTVYRSPNNLGDRQMNIHNAASYFLQVDGILLPPSTQTEAQLYPTSKTWGAEEGVYGIGVQSDIDNPFLAPQPTCPFWWYAPSLSDINGNVMYTAFSFAPVPANDGVGNVYTLAQTFPYENHGAIFTGLNYNSTLQVTVKYYVERVPTTSEPDLLVLSRPPTPYDPLALEIYNKAITELPVAVKVGENPLGEWFGEVLDIMVNVAPIVGGMAGPGGALMGSGVSSAIKAYRSMNRPENARPQPGVMRNPTQTNRSGRPRRRNPPQPQNQKKKKNKKRKPKLTAAQKAQRHQDLANMLGL
jgi:hypothetical protein